MSSLRSNKFQVFVQCRDYDGNEIFRKIGDVSLTDNQNGFCLTTGNASELDDTLKVDSIYPYARRSIKSIDVIKIVIQDTKLRRAPVLKKLEVWGIPSFRNSREDIDIIKKLWLAQPSSLQLKIPKGKLADVDPSFIIPEDFLDSITNELLVMPFILPSGNIIDETTMQKHNKHEEMYGRLPSDPFTGMVYRSESQPRFNESLKVRLDEFKLRHSHEIDVKLSGRTLGKKVEPIPSTSGYVANGHVSKKIKLNGNTSSDLDSLISSIYKNNQVTIFTKPRDLKTESPQRCNKCDLEKSTNLYQISSCSHVFCKPCLLQLNSTCETCKTTFQSKDVSRINL